MTAPFNFHDPVYFPIHKSRYLRLKEIRSNGPSYLESMKLYYRDNIADFIEDWGMTVDPRNVERGLPSAVPFILFPHQRACVEYILRKWKDQEPGLIEKSRDCGISWLAIAIGCTLSIFHPGMRVGFGSRKAEYVDKIDEPKSLFWKARFFMRNLPIEFRGGWRDGVDAPHMRILFPATGGSLTGEGGDDIGRGDRAGVYFVDEAAHLPRPVSVDAALSQTTNCRIDMSSVNGMNNPFATKRHEGKIEPFIFDWRDDPRKNDAWYAKQAAILDPVVLAQEVDRDYSASVEGVVIPVKWAKAAIDAHEKLGLSVSGVPVASYDVGGDGRDKNAVVVLRGFLVEHAEEWPGDAANLYKSVERVFRVCDDWKCVAFRYDAVGIGYGVGGDADQINRARRLEEKPALFADAYAGSEAVLDPEGEDMKGRKNEDAFANRKGQAWWRAKVRFQKTYRWVVEGVPCDPMEIISISSKIPIYQKLVAELSQATAGANQVGKIVVDKTPEGMKSPNLADALIQQIGGGMWTPMVVRDGTMRAIAAMGAARRGRRRHR